MSIVKVQIQGNATVVTIPQSFNVKPGTEYHVFQGQNGVLTLRPVRKVPATIGELFKDWHSEYRMPDDLKDWLNTRPSGEELY